MTFTGTLYEFQQESMERMVDRGQMLLAMVMGAGKTPTTIAAIEHLMGMGEVSKTIVIVPASLKYQWAKEIQKFTTSRALVIDGPKAKRNEQWRRVLSAQYVIVNPELLLKDKIPTNEFQAIVLDEATMIKSPRAARSRTIKKLGQRFHYRFALTGQPIENRPEELFSIMQFVDKEVLGPFDLFDRTFIVRDHFGKPIRYRNLKQLHESMKDAMVRKTRKDIEDQLPKVIQKVVTVPFDTLGARVYKHIAKDLLERIQQAITKHGRGFDLWSHYHGKDDKGEEQGQIMSRLTVLRMLCDNPQLIIDSANAFNDPTQHTTGSAYASDLVHLGLVTDVYKTPKLDAVIEYITDILEESPDNKVVLFSFFKNNLRLIQKAMAPVAKSVLFMGGMSAQDRDAAKEKFSTDPTVRLFLSSDAGGYGVDLPQANYLISYDLPWSAGKLDQRDARIIRLSSQHPHVTITSFVMRGSIEERQYEMLQQKRGINEAFIDGNYDSRGRFELTMGTLSEFIANSEV